MEWNELTSEAQLQDVLDKSNMKKQIIFKHSTRCSISKTVWNRMERTVDFPENADYYYLDLIGYRDVSNKIADQLNIEHESPQVIVIDKGRVVYDADHFEIEASELIHNLS